MSAVIRPSIEDCHECRNCGQPIFDAYGKWVHYDLGNAVVMEVGGISFQSDQGMVGCRAASFREDHGWNDSLDRKWTAKPKR